MGTWHRFTVTLCPVSYANLLLRYRLLKETNPRASKGTAVRYTLRRLGFDTPQKRAFVRAVDRYLPSEASPGVPDRSVLVELIAEELEDS